jgi:probable F420-dependent oxidoreductase
VLVLPLHHPVLLAKRAATVDRLSGGRLRLGVGLGWMPEEIEACGVAFADRGRMADESIDALRALWAATDEGASFDGEFFSFTDAHSYPKPWQAGGVPIHVGGSTRAAIARAARRGDGWQPLGLEGDELRAARDLLRHEAAAAGRDPDAIEMTLSGFGAATLMAEDLERAAADGACRVAVHCAPSELRAALDELSALADRVGLRKPA